MSRGSGRDATRVKIVVSAILLLLLLAACGGGGPSLDARVLQLNLTYSFTGPTEAVLTGGDGAAASGSQVECRLSAGGRPQIGSVKAGETGAFQMELILEHLPQQLPDSETFKRLNDSVECRSGKGSWTNPLKQPVLKIE